MPLLIKTKQKRPVECPPCLGECIHKFSCPSLADQKAESDRKKRDRFKITCPEVTRELGPSSAWFPALILETLLRLCGAPWGPGVF